MGIGELVYYVNKSNRDLSQFLLAIRYDDFTTRFSARDKGKSFEELYDAFNFIFDKLKEISSERQAQYLYLLRLVEHINVGIISFDAQGKIYLMNEALKQLLHTSDFSPRHIHDLNPIQPHFQELIQKIRPGERKLLKINRNHELLQLAVQATEFTLQGDYYKIISAQNIKNELDEQELDAWQKLIRVLTHEIMNSVAPITSLSATLQHITQNNAEVLSQAAPKMLRDFNDGLNVINIRSQGLLHFTESYKSLTNLPPPKFVMIQAQDLLQRVTVLFKSPMEAQQIQGSLEISPNNLSFLADPQLLEQALINLIKNAIEALENRPNPQINIAARKTPEGRIAIAIADNGAGIPEEILDRIFVPFYTTKDEGSGVGLSLSRQVMLLHRGSISVQSQMGKGTTFTLWL